MNNKLTDKELGSISGGVNNTTRTYQVDQIYEGHGIVFRILVVYSDSCLVAVYRKFNGEWGLLEGDAYPFYMINGMRDVTNDPEFQEIKDIKITFTY